MYTLLLYPMPLSFIGGGGCVIVATLCDKLASDW